MRLPVPSSVVPFALAVALATACGHQAAESRQLTAVKVTLVEPAVGPSGTRYSAHIEPATRVDMAFRVGGYIDFIAKASGIDAKPRVLQEGDAVREGQELASVRKVDYVQRLDEAKAAYEQARAAQAQAQSDLARAEQLVTTGSLPTVEAEVARTKVRTAAATVEGARARVDEASTALGDTALRSPMNGVVLKRWIEVGVLAAPGTPAFTIADVSSVKAVFAVPDTILPHVHLGAAQAVLADAFAGVTFQGRISRIAPSADPRSRVFEAEVMIPNSDQRLRSGMVASLSLDGVVDGAGARPLPLVPLAAIVRAPGKATGFAVFVVAEEAGQTVAHAREIEVGEYLGRDIPVSRGLAGGERVVVLGAGLLSDGETVEVIP
jgi:multidrug efflux system membrane fusion protein